MTVGTPPLRRHLPAPVLALLLGSLPACDAPPTGGAVEERPRLSVPELLGGPSQSGLENSLENGFERAVEPRPFDFPADHGPHPGFRTEWWYVTGNLATPAGRAFGYQLTFFRSALASQMPPRSSAWATRQIYMAHLALSDPRDGGFHAFERFSRDALGLAGAQAAPLRVWLEDWSLEGGPATTLPLRLRATEGQVALDLTLDSDKPIVLQGDRGLSQKGDKAGNASYYYSWTRMPTRGTLRIGGTDHSVAGSSWMDREWSTSALDADQIGWDWFSLQLDDGTELMYYRLRTANGGSHPASAGSLVDREGNSLRLDRDEATLEPLDSWRSTATGASYPSRWRLEVPSAELSLVIEPLLADQELRLSVLYWEGAVRFEGHRAGRRVAGRGYVELTGYGDSTTQGKSLSRGR